jgi:hypothetical protein
VNITIAASSSSTTLYGWTSPSQTGAYTVLVNASSTPGAIDSSTINVM